jgi:hypothetical protein
MEKFTIHMCHTTAHTHSGTLGRGPAARPKLAAFGSPQRTGPWPVHAWSARHVVTAPERIQRAVQRRALRRDERSSVMRTMAHPSALLRLHAATLGPTQGGQKRGAHR